MRPSQVVGLFAGLSAAFSWEGAFEDSAAKAVQGIEDVARLFRRQTTTDTGTTTAGGKATNTPSTGSTSSGTATTTNTKSTITGSASGSKSGSATASGSGKASSKAASSNQTTNIDPRLGSGGVTMMVPDRFAGAQYYKVGDWVTFAWNYTSVEVTPTAVNVIASCSTANAEWTIAANMSYDSTQTVLWDTNAIAGQQTPQLVMATYTLIVENADEAKATQATRLAGQVQSIQALTFGIYPPQPYVPFADFTCPMCSAAVSLYPGQALGLMATMVSLTIGLITWL